MFHLHQVFGRVLYILMFMARHQHNKAETLIPSGRDKAATTVLLKGTYCMTVSLNLNRLFNRHSLTKCIHIYTTIKLKH